jgi:hypothetical protein
MPFFGFDIRKPSKRGRLSLGGLSVFSLGALCLVWIRSGSLLDEIEIILANADANRAAAAESETKLQAFNAQLDARDAVQKVLRNVR